MNKIGNRGFTLIELLAGLAILTIAFIIVLNVMKGTEASTRTQIKAIGDNEVFEAAKFYVMETNPSFNKDGYVCISLKDLVNYGYIRNTGDNNKIIKVSRNNQTKVINNIMYDDNCK